MGRRVDSKNEGMACMDEASYNETVKSVVELPADVAAALIRMKLPWIALESLPREAAEVATLLQHMNKKLNNSEAYNPCTV
ncbi:hypothetical protein ACE6H2_016272 [Prunus campanulata]